MKTHDIFGIKFKIGGNTQKTINCKKRIKHFFNFEDIAENLGFEPEHVLSMKEEKGQLIIETEE